MLGPVRSEGNGESGYWVAGRRQRERPSVKLNHGARAFHRTNAAVVIDGTKTLRRDLAESFDERADPPSPRAQVPK